MKGFEKPLKRFAQEVRVEVPISKTRFLAPAGAMADTDGDWAARRLRGGGFGKRFRDLFALETEPTH